MKGARRLIAVDRPRAYMTTPKYGAFESNPARFTDYEERVYQHDNVWREMNVAECCTTPVS